MSKLLAIVHITKLISELSKKHFISIQRSFSKHLDTIDASKIRNIGIIAHIDAGKTTTTERMLYYSGFTKLMGEVHDGDTVMDYMVQERQRGITITSAAITFSWKKHKINLIDTPGHVDFTFEVERALCALDGAIAILDSSAGVEVQTLKVWEQANKYNIPCIIYLNKMDKPTANLDMCLESLKQKLKIKPLLLHVPVGQGKNFKGVVDLITQQKIIWSPQQKDDGQNFSVGTLDNGDDLCLLVKNKRQELIESIADYDDAIADKFLTQGADSLTITELLSALHRITLSKLAFPVLCGSSYKNIGVQLLMDAVINYLPNPDERARDFLKYYDNELCALVFKIIHNKQKEPLSFLRIYSGTLKNDQKVYNVNREKSEKIGKLMIAQADDFREVSIVDYGNIAVVNGIKEAVTGDTLVSSASVASKIKADAVPTTINVPNPVFFCTIEPPSVGMQKKLDFALYCMQKEDPTFQVEIDEDIGQTIISGMGELHIEVIKDRIKTEHGVDSYLGPLQIAYRESLGEIVEHTHVLDKMLAGAKHYVNLTMKIYPSKEKESLKEVNVIVTKDNELGKIRSDYLKAINAGMKTALKHGPILNFPVINVEVDLLCFQVGKGTSHPMISAASAQCIAAALRKSKLYLLEPIMNLSIVVSKGYAGRVLNDLSQKRSQILSMDLRQDVEVILSKTPLAELKGYSTHLRALTSGTCSFTIEFDSYNKMDNTEQMNIVKSARSFY